MSWYGYGRFPEYRSVAEKKERNEKELVKLKKKYKSVSPVIIQGRSMVKNFWGKSWLKNIESYADYAYRLERGRSYVRHGAVLDLKINPGEIKALVCGTSNYKVHITISEVSLHDWHGLIKECSGKINSLIELLQGKLSQHIMEIITQPNRGLFPKSQEIKFTCSCPDHAYMCKHVAAVLYGIGVRIDEFPEFLFVLRQVDHTELLVKATKDVSLKSFVSASQDALDGDLSNIFGVDVVDAPIQKKPEAAKKAKAKKTVPAASFHKVKVGKKATTKKKKVPQKKKSTQASNKLYTMIS